MSLRRRNEFDGVNPVHEENLTKYDEKFTVHTEPSVGYGMLRDSMYGGAQSPVQTPAPDPTEHNYVFGRREEGADGRANVFGGDGRQNYVSPTAREFNVVPPVKQKYNSAPAPQEFNSAPVVSSERPMVFMLRDDENMFVYEYSDRLEYYRRTDVGMVHCATKYKAKKR